jgi:hypothetical protein
MLSFRSTLLVAAAFKFATPSFCNARYFNQCYKRPWLEALPPVKLCAGSASAPLKRNLLSKDSGTVVDVNGDEEDAPMLYSFEANHLVVTLSKKKCHDDIAVIFVSVISVI